MSRLKKFFRELIPDQDSDDEDTVKEKSKPKPKYYGTVLPYPYFDASSDTSVLHQAIECKDMDKIINIFVKRNNSQRQQIKAIYESSTGNKLEDDLKSVLRSDFEDVVVSLLMTPAHFDAYTLWEATHGKCFGTDEDVITEIFATRTNQEREDINRVYREVYGIDLEDVIKDETKGTFRRILLALLKAKKVEHTEVDNKLAQEDARRLYEAGEGTPGFNVNVFIEIFTERSSPQLCKTFQHYSAISELSLPKALQKELCGDTEDCFIDLVKCAYNAPAVFAEKLHNATMRHGTCEKTLNRILVSRSECDLKKILKQYKAMYNRPLQEVIQEETSDCYQKILLELCGVF
ncbi:annexin A1-like isoform 1-T1 [Pholidichthys leucotaenia]